MSAYAGSLVPVASPYVALDRLPLVLLLGALVVALSGDRLEPRRRHAVSLVSIGMSLGLLAVHVAQLVMLEPTQRALRDVTTNLVRIGSFEANLGFFLDPTAAFFLIGPLVGAAYFLGKTKFVKANDGAARRFQSSVLLLCAGVSTTVLADGFVGLLIGLAMTMVATYLLVVRDERLSRSLLTAERIYLMQSAGSAALIAAFLVLFWNLGGAFRNDGYLNDYRARFVAVHAPGHLPAAENVVMPEEMPHGERDAAAIAKRAKERGTLTFTSHPGTRVFVDAGDKNLDRAEPFAVAPFVRKELAAGVHEVLIVPGGAAIVTGDGHEVGWIERLIVDTNEDVSIVPVGPATTFSEVEDQLSMVDDEAKHSLRNAVFNRAFYGSLGVVSALVFLATLGVLLLGVPVLLVPWISPKASTPTWNVLRLSTVVLMLYPLIRLRSFVSFHLDVVAGLFVLAAALAMLVRSRRAVWIVGAATMLLCTSEGRASADDSARMVLRPERGSVVELDYAPDGETMVGAFVIRNDGSSPLTITGARMEHYQGPVRIPPFVTVEVDGAKGQPVVLKPGQERRAIVRWKYGLARAREFYGFAFAEPSDVRVGNLVPVHAARSRDLGPWGDHALSFLIGFPLLASVLALVLRLLRRDERRLLALSSGLVFAVEFAFVLACWNRFDSRFGRVDGNDGLQFVERGLLSSVNVEYFFGADGLSLALVIILSLVALLTAIASSSLREGALGFHVGAPVFVSAAMGVFLAQNLVLFCAFWLVGMLAAWGIVGRTAMRSGVLSLAGMVFLGAAASWLYGHSDPSYLVDGRFVVKSLDLPDLALVNWVNVETTLFGAPPIAVVWSALFVAFVLRIVQLPDSIVASNAPTQMLFPAGFVATGVYGLVRFSIGILPAGMQWAATTVIVLGVVMLVVFTVVARKQTNLRIRMAHGANAYAGFALIGLGSCTPQGIAGALFVAVALMLGQGLWAMIGQVEERDRPLNGPGFTWLSLVGVFVVVGMPGLVGFWGPLLSVVGAFPRQPLWAIVAISAAGFLGVTQISPVGRKVFGAVDAKPRKNQSVDLGLGELMVVVPLVLVVIGLGFSPRTLFSLLDTLILDLHRLVDAVGPLQVG